MATLRAKDRNALPDHAFGIPSKRAYPLYKLDGKKLVPDKTHIESAVKLFGHASRDDKPQLAKNILKAAHEAGMDTSGWNEVNKWAGHANKQAETKKEKIETESAMSFDIAMAVADIVLEYGEILYEEFYESVYSDDETFMESISDPDDVQEAVPGLWEDYLRQHMPSYDPKTHTVSVKPGTRKQAQWPKATSKEMNRRNAFLKRHKFDPKTGTIEIDEIDPATGQKMRIPFQLSTDPNKLFGGNHVAFHNSPDIPMDPLVRMTLVGTDLTQKPDFSEPIIGHETAHIHQRNAVRKLARQFPHHRVMDDLLAAQARAEANGDKKAAAAYKSKADEYYLQNKDAIEAETDKIRKHIIPGSQATLGTDAMNAMHATNPDYQRAVQNASANTPFLNSHDKLPDELHADDYGEELAKRYTRGRRTGARSLSRLGDTPEEYAETVKSLRNKVKQGQERTIELQSTPMSRYNDAIGEINKNHKILQLDIYTSELEHPTMGLDVELIKAKIAQLKADPEVQDLLAKREALREEYEKVSPDKRRKREQVPNPDPAYAGIDLDTISDDDLIDRIDPSIRSSNEKRTEIARQVAAEKAARDLVNQQYRRKLSRDALQTQLDSGKLTPQQEKKARQKIASIDAFERKAQSAVDGTPITTKPKKKKSSSITKTEPQKTTTPTKPESDKKPEETRKKDEIKVPSAAKKDSMTVNDQTEPKK